jgi:hypothetical protein
VSDEQQGRPDAFLAKCSGGHRTGSAGPTGSTHVKPPGASLDVPLQAWREAGLRGSLLVGGGWRVGGGEALEAAFRTEYASNEAELECRHHRRHEGIGVFGLAL